MDIIVVFEQMLIIFTLILLGYFLSKRGMVKEETAKQLSGIVVNVCNPALVLTSIFQDGGSITARQLLWATIVCIVIYAAMILLGKLLPMCIRAPREESPQYELMTIFGNTGFIGIPVVSAVLGSTALIYVVVINIVFNFLAYTYGVYLVGKGRSTEKFQWKKLVNVGTVSGILCIVLLLTDIKVPEVVQSTFDYIGRGTTFLSMVVIGVTVAQIPIRKLLGGKRMYFFILLRFLAVPIMLAIAMRPFVRDPLMFGTFALIFAMPAGNLPLMMMEERGLDGTLLSRGIILSTLFAVVSVTAVAYFI